MKKSNRRKTLRKETINRAAKYFLTGDQEIKNKSIDIMFEEQPALMQFMKYMDTAHPNELNKEIILQLMTIIYLGIKFEKIRIKKIKFGQILKSLDDNTKMKSYFHDDRYSFDSSGFKEIYNNHEQKNILNYTYFAINNQFKEFIQSERDAIFIFYSIKTIADVISIKII